MTGEKILKRALSYLMEKPGDDKVFLNNALELLNALIAECIECQNSRNLARGENKITSAEINSLTDEVKLDDIFVEVAIPFGLASAFFHDELDYERANIMRSRFESILVSAGNVNFSDIADIYGGEE